MTTADSMVKHDWRWKGNFSVPIIGDRPHTTEIGVYQCVGCGKVDVSLPKPGQPTLLVEDVWSHLEGAIRDTECPLPAHDPPRGFWA